MLPPLLSIGALASRTGLSVSAIRYYESVGLIAPARNAGGHRRFLRADIRRLSFVIVSQNLGIPLARIKALLARLPTDRAPDPRDWADMAAEMRAELDARIQTLSRLRDTLDGCIGCGCLSMRACALFNPQDAAARHGAGPRYLLGDPDPQSAPADPV
ncbi:MAG: redox-sensitive transcriptional activator SoxR [Pseudomonadota bacterium]